LRKIRVRSQSERRRRSLSQGYRSFPIARRWCIPADGLTEREAVEQPVHDLGRMLDRAALSTGSAASSFHGSSSLRTPTGS
jgi:hypothetical protein